jgi:Flp pilus assembly pilin Flp
MLERSLCTPPRNQRSAHVTTIGETKRPRRFHESLDRDSGRHSSKQAGAVPLHNIGNRRVINRRLIMQKLLTRMAREDEGQDLIEYALLAAFLSLVAAGGAAFVGTQLDAWYDGIGGTIGGMNTGPVAP